MNKRRHIISLTLLLVVVASALVANLVAGNTPALGLDLQGGASVTLQPDGEFDPAGLDVAVEIIRARVDSIGVAEPEIILQGSTVIVNLPGVKDQQQALDIIGRTGELLLRPVLQSGMLNPNADTTIPGSATTVVDSSTTVPGQTSDSVEDGARTISGGPGASRVISTATTTPDSSTSVPTETTDAQAVTPIADAPQTAENLGLGDDPNDPTQTVLLLDKNGIAYVVGPAGASGKVFKNDARADVQTGEWAVVVGLRSGPDGDQLWNKLAAACFNKTAECPTGQLAMVLDGTVISAPTVNEPEFTGGTVQISGSFTPQEARELAKILEFGAVPVRFCCLAGSNSFCNSGFRLASCSDHFWSCRHLACGGAASGLLPTYGCIRDCWHDYFNSVFVERHFASFAHQWTCALAFWNCRHHRLDWHCSRLVHRVFERIKDEIRFGKHLRIQQCAVLSLLGAQLWLLTRFRSSRQLCCGI